MEEFDLGGEMVKGEDVSYNPINEPWYEYILEDGTTLLMKVVVKRVIRTEKYNSDKDPVYIVQSMMVMDTRVPSNLKQGQEDDDA